MIRLYTLLFAAFLLQMHAARAALVLSLEPAVFAGTSTPGPFGVGDSVSIAVTAYVTGTTPNDLQAFSLPLDFGGLVDGSAGFGTSSPDMNFTNSSVANGAFASTTITANSPPSTALWDWRATGSGGTVLLSSLSASPTKLFDLTFDVGPGSLDGTYAIIPRRGTGTSKLVFTTSQRDINNYMLNSGQVQIAASAVPEPGSVALLTGIFAAAGAYRLRSRGRATQMKR